MCKSSAKLLNILSSKTARNDIVEFTPSSESNSEPVIEYSFPPDSFTIKYAQPYPVLRILPRMSTYASINPLAK